MDAEEVVVEQARKRRRKSVSFHKAEEIDTDVGADEDNSGVTSPNGAPAVEAGDTLPMETPNGHDDNGPAEDDDNGDGDGDGNGDGDEQDDDGAQPTVAEGSDDPLPATVVADVAAEGQAALDAQATTELYHALDSTPTMPPYTMPPRDGPPPATLSGVRVPLQYWEVGTRYHLVQILGHGSYGEVAEAVDTETGERVAIKRIPDIFQNATDARRILREIYILRHLRHPNIIELLDIVMPKSYEEFSDLYLVFEYVDTDLYKLITSKQFLTQLHIQTFVYQLLCGLKYIHARHVIHRDLKPANILLNEDCSLRICDFGLSRVIRIEYPAPSPSPPVISPSSAADRTRRGMASPQPGLPSPMYDRLRRSRSFSAAPLPKSSPVLPLRARGFSDGGFDEDTKAPPFRRVASDMSADMTSAVNPPTSGGASGGAAAPAPGARKSTKRRSSSPVPSPNPISRQLTKHVVTRWYRPPELILLQEYNLAVDMWSVGCIFAELLSMEQLSVPDYRDRVPLFPGKSCFPLSADNPSSFSDTLDQLNVIFHVIGTPGKNDLGWLVGDAKKYLDQLPQQPPQDLCKIFPGAPTDSLDLLKRMLVFNPAERITVTQALDHPYFRDVRRPDQEEVDDHPIPMMPGSEQSPKQTLKDLIYQEVLFYHRQEDAVEAPRTPNLVFTPRSPTVTP